MVEKYIGKSYISKSSPFTEFKTKQALQSAVVKKMRLLKSKRAIKSDNTLPEWHTRRRIIPNKLPTLKICTSFRNAIRFTLGNNSIR